MSAPDVERLERAYKAAADNLRRALPTNKGGTAAEARYAAAYQALVQAGAAPQIRRKYRKGGLAK